MTTTPVLYLTVGLPGTGKTTLARRVAAEHGILRLTPDEWMVPLFGDSQPEGRRDILEGRLIWVAHQVLRSGSSVVLDFGCWSPEERFAIRVIAESAGARFELRELTLGERERRTRARARWESGLEATFPMTDADHDLYLSRYQPPTDAERSYGPVPDAPSEDGNWFRWAGRRWPSLPDLEPEQDDRP